jgi:subtilisin family serine protease
LVGDDDENGFQDDFRGWDFIDPEDNNPDDDNGHGTHVSGTVGAEGDNGIGVVGVNWSVSLMPLKFLDEDGVGKVSDEIEAIDYAISEGAHIINASFSGSRFSQTEYDAISRARDAGILFVAAAGNDGDDSRLVGWDNDQEDQANYPASYDLDNIIAVAATDPTDSLAEFSNFGVASVDLVAPGVGILSTTTGNRYKYLSGTSMAAPHVAGLAALIWSDHLADGSFDYGEAKTRIFNGVEVIPALTERLLMAGRINASSSMNPALDVPDGPPSDFHAVVVSNQRIDLKWIDHASNESGFKIARGPSPQGPFRHVATVAADVEFYSDTRFEDGVEYTYRVSAFNSAGDTAPSNAEDIATALIAPDNLSAQAVSSSRIDLLWADNSSGELGYRVERRIGPDGVFSDIATVDRDVDIFIHNGLQPSTTYIYRVKAFNNNGESSYSNEAEAETPSPPSGGGGGGCFIDIVASGTP